MGSMPVGVHDIFHEMGPSLGLDLTLEMGPFLAVHRQSVQSADVLVAPVRQVVSPSFFRSSSLILAIHNSKDDLFYQSCLLYTSPSPRD